MSEVIALAGWPPEVLAYAYAMYSRSRLPVAFENISQIAAFELEDQSLWDGQERSTRYQSFDSADNFFIPVSVRGTEFENKYLSVAEMLLDRYRFFSKMVFQQLCVVYPRPLDMKEDAYERTLRARAFDVARYFLFNGIKTNVGQITSARTLEEQASRLISSPYQELREIGEAIKIACKSKPFCPEDKNEPPVAPTLLKYVVGNDHIVLFHEKMIRLAEEFLVNCPNPNYKSRVFLAPEHIDLLDEVVATLFYQHSRHCYIDILGVVSSLSASVKKEIFDIALADRGQYDQWPRALAAGYALQFDLRIDRGGQRDLHRHRNCIQIHQPLSPNLGWERPALICKLNLEEFYDGAMASVAMGVMELKKEIGVDANYLLPFSFRSPTLYKMSLAQANYMIELRSGQAGHFSYREAACQMHDLTVARYPFLEDRIRVTPFENENIFKR